MSKLEQLLSKEMTRRQFLGTLGVSIASLFGVSAIMGVLSGSDPQTNNNRPDYGQRSYGP